MYMDDTEYIYISDGNRLVYLLGLPKTNLLFFDRECKEEEAYFVLLDYFQ